MKTTVQNPLQIEPARTVRRAVIGVTCWALLALLIGCGAKQSYVGDVVAGSPAVALAGTNWNGERFELDSLAGKTAVIFFGYTYCPDVCPFTLVKMKQLYAKLGDSADDVAVVFVSVDPHRDSIEKLAQYVPNFDPRFIGLRLEFDEIEAIEDDYGLSVQYGQPKDGPGTDTFYYVDHTGSYFLIDPEGKLRLRHPPNATVDDIYKDVQALLTS